MRSSRVFRAAIPIALALLASCGGSVASQASIADVVMSAAALGSEVDVIVIRVTASDIPTPLLFNLKVVDGFASGNLKVPAGAARAFLASAFDRSGAVTAEGSAVLDIQQGTNPPATISLVPKAGRQPITINLGSVSVQVSPGSASTTVGGSVQFSAIVRIGSGQAVTVALDWATASPAVALIDGTGLARCVGLGTAEIQAVAEGIPGVASITCTEPPAAAVSTGGEEP
jgi:hypothetical protein